MAIRPARRVGPTVVAPASCAAASRYDSTGALAAQSAKFVVVGAVGYGVNLGTFIMLRQTVHLEVHEAAICAFLASFVHNYTLNRRWTFGADRQSLRQVSRFAAVSVATLAVNLMLLRPLLAIGAPDVLAQALAIAVGTPASFILNKFWSFRLPDER